MNPRFGGDPVSCHITISGEFRIGLCNDDMYKQDVVRCMQCFMNVCDIRMRHVLEGLSFQVPGVKCNYHKVIVQCGDMVLTWC